jgi:hypothetical protein
MVADNWLLARQTCRPNPASKVSNETATATSINEKPACRFIASQGLAAG